MPSARSVPSTVMQPATHETRAPRASDGDERPGAASRRLRSHGRGSRRDRGRPSRRDVPERLARSVLEEPGGPATISQPHVGAQSASPSWCRSTTRSARCARCSSASRAVPIAEGGHRRRRLLDRRHARGARGVSAPRRRTRPTSGWSSLRHERNQGKGAAVRTAVGAHDRRHRRHPGRRPRVRPARVPAADPARSSTGTPTSSSARASPAARAACCSSGTRSATAS